MKPIPPKTGQEAARISKKTKRMSRTVEKGKTAEPHIVKNGQTKTTKAIPLEKKEVTTQPSLSPELKEAIEKANQLIAFKNPLFEPKLDEETLNKFANLSLDEQVTFIQGVNVQIAKANEPQDWGNWFLNAAKKLKDRVVNFYAEGKEDFNLITDILGLAAGQIYWNISTQIQESTTKKTLVNWANTSVNYAGNIALATTQTAIPFMAEWSYKIALVVTGTQELGEEAAKEVNAEAKGIRDAIENYLNATHIPEKPVSDLTTSITTKLGEYTPPTMNVFTIIDSQGGMVNLLAEGVKSGLKTVPQYALAFRVNQLLIYASPVQLNEIQSSVVVSCVVTVLSVGPLPLKESLVHFLINNPAALTIALTKIILDNTTGPNFFLSYGVWYALSQFTEKVIIQPMEPLLTAIEDKLSTTK